MTRGGGARAAVASIAAVVLLAAPAASQQAEIGAGVAVVSRLLVDGNGTTVRAAPAPYVAVELARPTTDPARRRLVATARAAYASVRASDGAARWRLGTALHADLAVGVVQPLRRGLRARAAAGVALVGGPSRVPPFAGRAVWPLVELGVDARVRGRLRADVRAQALRVAPTDGAAGGVARLLVGVAYAP